MIRQLSLSKYQNLIVLVIFINCHSFDSRKGLCLVDSTFFAWLLYSNCHNFNVKWTVVCGQYFGYCGIHLGTTVMDQVVKYEILCKCELV